MFKKSDPLAFFHQIGGKQMVDDILQVERTIKQYDKIHAIKRASEGDWQHLGAIKKFTPYERGIRYECERGWAELEWIAPDALRVRLSVHDDEFEPPHSFAVAKNVWPDMPFDHVERADLYKLRSSHMVCLVGKKPFRLAFETAQGKRVCLDTRGMYWRPDGTIRLSMGMHPEESSYGLGERASGLNLRGKQLALWNIDPPRQYVRDADPLYYSIPFYLGVQGDAAYGIFWDNSSRGSIDIGAAVPNELTFEGTTGELRYYIFVGADANSVLERYTELTGRIQMPPLWALGYHQSRHSYSPQASVLELAAEFRSRQMPCDALYLDIHYMDGYRIFTWDQERFPDPKGMIDQLHDQGFKVIPIVDPGIKVDPSYSAYQSGLAQDVFMKYPDGQRYIGVVWPGACHFPDFTLPRTRTWWSLQFASLINAGVDGIWNDMCEPVVFGGSGFATVPPDYVVHTPEGTRGGTHLEYHNLYGMLMARATLMALEKFRPNKRQVNIVRSGYAGAQRYAISWTGDNQADWDHLKLSISMTLNMGLSGAPMIGPDIGGYNQDPSPELFTRWLQAMCLMPFFRNHASISTAPQEPWVHGQPYELINRLTILLRYRLMSYLYSAVALCREYGSPVVRPLFMLDPTNIALRNVDDCFLLGDALLAAPVVEEGGLRRSVLLPPGEWYDFWTFERYEGGQTVEIPAPLERLPLMVRAGAVLPLWPEMQYIGEKPVDTLLLRVFMGQHDTVLYEDRGEGLEYRSGDYRWVYLTTKRDGNYLRLTRRTAGRYQPEYQTIRLEFYGLDEEPLEVKVDRQGAPLWFFEGGVLEVTADDSFSVVEIILHAEPDDRTVVRRPF